MRSAAHRRTSMTQSGLSVPLMKSWYKSCDSAFSVQPSAFNRLARNTHSSGNWEIMKAKFVFTPSPCGGTVKSPRPGWSSGLPFRASSGSEPAFRNSAEGITTSLYAGMICDREGTEPGSKYAPVSASVLGSNTVPLPGFCFSIHVKDWKKKAKRSDASPGKRVRWIGFAARSRCVSGASPSMETPAACTSPVACLGLINDSCIRLFTMTRQMFCQPGPKVRANRSASLPWCSRRSIGRDVFFKSFRSRLWPITLPTTAAAR
mmetsp:Transcript_36355/g.109921  ORF Transcript_36355/g.109921 Transcript_36355/m.109921 type:complete len:262 (-) Transcript_36355:72-857(-)